MTQRDIGTLCVQCRRDTKLGTGLFVNRIPSSTDDEIGWLCHECQLVECDKCGELSDMDDLHTIEFSFGAEQWCDTCVAEYQDYIKEHAEGFDG